MYIHNMQGGIIFRLRHQTQTCDLRVRVRDGHKKLIMMHVHQVRTNSSSALDQDADSVKCQCDLFIDAYSC